MHSRTVLGARAQIRKVKQGLQRSGCSRCSRLCAEQSSKMGARDTACCTARGLGGRMPDEVLQSTWSMVTRLGEVCPAPGLSLTRVAIPQLVNSLNHHYPPAATTPP